jgi:hypothetical protein
MNNAPEGWDEDPQEQSVPQEEEACESVLREEREIVINRIKEQEQENETLPNIGER